jgi:2-isopropylmalate synthase
MRRVEIFDTTLRDGEQSPGISLSVEEKVEIARQLARLKVDVIEAGFPITSEGDFESVSRIASEVKGPRITGLARIHEQDIVRAWEAVQWAQRPRIHTFVGTSDLHIEHQMRSNRDDILRRAGEAVAFAKNLCENVEFSPMDATRTDIGYLSEIVAAAVQSGADVVNIADTVGYTTPVEFADFLKELRERVPALEERILSVHCHDDLGMAVANSLAGVEVGAGQVEVAVNGIGERAGNASLEEVVMALATRSDYYGARVGVETRQLANTSRMVSNITGYEVPPNKAIVSARVGHPPGWRAQEQAHLRDHDQGRHRPGRNEHLPRQALGPPRPQGRPGRARLLRGGRCAQAGLHAFQGDSGPQEDRDSRRPGGYRR